MNLTTIVDMGRAWFRAYTGPDGDELALDGKPGANDPVAFRMGTFDHRSYFGKISMDFLTGNPADPTRYERGFIALRPDDDDPASQQTNFPAAAIEIYLTRAGGSSDADEVRVLRLTSNYLEVFGKRFILKDQDPSTVRPDRMWSADGRFCTVQQGDGNFVTYDTTLGEVGSGPAAVWSAWGGKIR